MRYSRNIANRCVWGHATAVSLFIENGRVPKSLMFFVVVHSSF